MRVTGRVAYRGRQFGRVALWSQTPRGDVEVCLPPPRGVCQACRGVVDGQGGAPHVTKEGSLPPQFAFEVSNTDVRRSRDTFACLQSGLIVRCVA